MRFPVIPWAALVFCLLGSRTAPAAEFRDDVERDFPLRAIGQLQITNLRGGITIQGWALDKIRVKARRKAVAATPEEAKRLFAAVDFRYRSIDGDIELSAEYGKGLEIQERLKEREHPQTSMEMVVMAPANLRLRVWTLDGALSVKSWTAPLEVRSASGPIHLEGLKSDSVSLLCPSCAVSGRNLRGSFRCMGGSGNVDLSDVVGSQVYVETTTGAQKVAQVTADQIYVSKSGAVSGRGLRGRIEFHSQKGAVEFQDVAGFASGRTESGNILITMSEWKFLDKALIESSKGNISLALPGSFSGELDVWSMSGHASLGFPVQALREAQVYGPEPASRLRGSVGEGGEQLRVYSQDGDIKILRGV